MKKVISFILIIFLISVLIVMKEYNYSLPQLGTTKFVITPHFMIQPKIVDERYRYLSQTYKDFSPDTIIVLSPNHFDRGSTTLESVDSSFTRLCYRTHCSKAGSLTNNKIGNGFGKNKNSDIDDIIRPLQQKGYAEIIDHGIGEHLVYINKFFPHSTIYPLLVDEYSAIGGTQVEQELENIIKRFEQEKKQTLVIASVDFSHYMKESFAYIHDKKAIYILQDPNSQLKDFMDIEVDCPACLWGVNTAARSRGQTPNLRYRDSAASIVSGTIELKAKDNTSRQFRYFTDSTKKQVTKKYRDTIDQKFLQQSGLTIAFFGDLIYDRGVETLLQNENALYRHFKYFFMKEDPNLPLEIYNHRPLKSIDMVGFNNEMPITRTGKEKSEDCVFTVTEPRFCGHNKIITVLKNLGFTFTNLANNHVLRDQGTEGFVKTVHELQKEGIATIGYMSTGSFLQNNVLTGNIRGITYARHGYDFTLTKGKVNEYCTILKSYKEKGFINFVSAHWGIEYQNQHNASQKTLAHTLIDCGAEIIVGHHPHVVQDIERYKGKPIIYSLGNLLFDQGFSQQTQTGSFVLIDRSNQGIQIETGNIPAFPQK